MPAKKVTNLTLAGQAVPFDGEPRLNEIEAYSDALKAGGEVMSLVKEMVPAIVNSRLKPAQPFALEDHTVINEETALGVLEVVKAIQGTLNSPKVKAALTEISMMIRQNPSAAK